MDLRRSKSLLFKSYFSKCFPLGTIFLTVFKFHKENLFCPAPQAPFGWRGWLGLCCAEAAGFCFTPSLTGSAGRLPADSQIPRPWAATFHIQEFYSLELCSTEFEGLYELVLPRNKQLNIYYFGV